MENKPIYKESGRRDFLAEFRRDAPDYEYQIALVKLRESKIRLGIAILCLLLVIVLTTIK